MKRVFIFALCFTLLGCKPELTVEVALPGIVTSDDGTINCGLGVCVREITGKEMITLTASESNLFYPFHHWEGGCTGTDPVCELELDPSLPITVKAQFAHSGTNLIDIEFEDPMLQSCVRGLASDYLYNGASAPYLNCSSMGIESLSGIEELDKTNRYFTFDNNQISDLEPLQGHRFTLGLSLRNNAIVNPMPLKDVEISGELLLEGNPDINCDAMQYLVDHNLMPLVPTVPQCDIYPQVMELESVEGE